MNLKQPPMQLKQSAHKNSVNRTDSVEDSVFEWTGKSSFAGLEGKKKGDFVKSFGSEKENMCPNRQAMCGQEPEIDEEEVAKLRAFQKGARGRRGGVRKLQLLPISMR
jgi:hypothetical protein